MAQERQKQSLQSFGENKGQLVGEGAAFNMGLIENKIELIHARAPV